MKKITTLIAALALTISACNQAGNEGQKVEHAKGHETNQTENVMMKVMEDSMMEMHQARQTGNADYDFASMMIPHHEGAIKMAEAVIREGKSVALIEFAKKVVVAQKNEIKVLTDFLKTADQTPSKNATQFKEALSASMKPMMDGMSKVKLTNQIDQDFVALMIPHHQSAVDMAKAYLPYASNPDIKLVAEQILKAQEEEIKWLQEQ